MKDAREASWEDCLNNSSARAVSQDMERAQALVETAKGRMELISQLTEKNCNYAFEDFYTSLLEILQALTFRKGYNVLNHICLGYYIRDILNREDLFQIFDDLRYKRNSLTYYGRRMDYETAKHAIDCCKKIISEIETLFPQK